MYLEQLECLVEVAKTGSLTGAANNLHISLSAVSQSISALEAELGVVLFTRSRVGSVPTAEGQRIIKKAFEIIGKVQELRNEAAGSSRTQSGELRLVTIPGPLSLAIDVIMNFKQDYPGIAMTIAEKSTTDIMDDIRHNRADLGLTVLAEQEAKGLAGLSFGKLMEARMVVAVSRQHALAYESPFDPSQLGALPLILYQDETVKSYMDQAESKYGPFNVLFSTNNTETIRKAVCEGMAATVGLDFSFLGLPSYIRGELALLPLSVPGQRTVYLGWLHAEEKHFSNPSRLFIERLQAEMEQLRAVAAIKNNNGPK
ncbi:LysR family transcriptional regulator [Paenibacillus ginsengarvi]|uniref:LysR family transcriptional regulator n=2 Tax=Paenibacillus ginsengarvi TaxID=400777 RepID=A0A3B0CPP1_9BACL|nr:LysR family transcriptional regulator [Paenibacillus ginsengarvi]